MNIGATIPSLSTSPSKKWRPSKRTVIVLIIVIFLLALFLIGYYYFSSPISPAPGLGGFLQARSTKIELKTEYKNPFDRTNQYVNPFGEFKSSFTSLQ